MCAPAWWVVREPWTVCKEGGQSCQVLENTEVRSVWEGGGAVGRNNRCELKSISSAGNLKPGPSASLEKAEVGRGWETVLERSPIIGGE